MTLFVICSLMITVKTGNIVIKTKADVEGRVLKQNSIQYLADFNEGVKRFNGVGDYSKIIVYKDSCLQEN